MNALPTQKCIFFCMNISEVINILELWAPKEIAWERDNTGLQTGNREGTITNILLSLDLTDDVITEAINQNCNLIITHHPLLFSPLKKIDLCRDKIAAMIVRLIKNDITLYSAHTNLDFTKEGVSFRLAEQLELNDIKFLKNISANQYKLTVFVPEENEEKVADAIFKSGGGIIGEYSKCSFRTNGTGTFKGSDKTNPATGSPGKYEENEEIKLEIIADKWKVNNILKALEAVHPYEEIAYDLIPIDNPNVNYGAGATGQLKEKYDTDAFLKYVSEKLGIRTFRYNQSGSKEIKLVGVCGGAGSDLVNEAISKGCDAFITGDIKYHTFHEAEGKILLIDAGHYETEIQSLDEVKGRLGKMIPEKENVMIYKFSGTTNPVIFYNT